MNEPSTEHALRGDLRLWAEASGCRLLVLFGSRADGPQDDPSDRGEMASDVDLAVQFGELPEPLQRLDIVNELQDLCGSMRADVVFLHLRTDPVLRFEIFRSGLPVYEAEEGVFIDEKVRALMLYEDALPFRRMLREKLRGESNVT